MMSISKKFCFIDQTSFSTANCFTRMRCWQPVSDPFYIQCPEREAKSSGKLTLFFAVSPSLKDNMAWMFADQTNQVEVVKFLKHIKSKLRNPNIRLCCVADNHSSHTQVETLRLIEEYNWELQSTPIYSPQANLAVERAFSYIKKALATWMCSLSADELKVMKIDDVKRGVKEALLSFNSSFWGGSTQQTSTSSEAMPTSRTRSVLWISREGRFRHRIRQS